MDSRTIFSMALLTVASAACGCGSTGMVTRGQDVHAPAPGQFQQYRAPGAAVHDHISGQHTSYYTDGYGPLDHHHQAGGQSPAQGNCPPNGYCPQNGNCPQDGYGGAGPNCFPKHHRTYSYSVPNDLSYPAQSGPGAVGGAVVYPYYTHKGPSDFFRQK